MRFKVNQCWSDWLTPPLKKVLEQIGPIKVGLVLEKALNNFVTVARAVVTNCRKELKAVEVELRPVDRSVKKKPNPFSVGDSVTKLKQNIRVQFR